MHLSILTVTYLRPKLLGRMIRCFLEQDYPSELRELIVLDDAGQYGDESGAGWRVVSVPRRFATLGQKRNAVAALASPRVEGFVIWDDDDRYLPWALSASAAALAEADWSRPSLVLHDTPQGSLRRHKTLGLFHGGWAYRRKAFERVGGYPWIDNGEDQGLAKRFEAAGITQADPIALGFDPFYVYQWDNDGYHLSNLGPKGYRRLGMHVAPKRRLVIPQRSGMPPVIETGVYERVF